MRGDARARCGLVLLLTSMSAVVPASADPKPTSVVLVAEPEAGRFGYSFRLGDRELLTIKSLMDELAEHYVDGQRLAVLIRDDVKIEALEVAASAASKVGYAASETKFFVFSSDRSTMSEIALPSHTAVPFSIDPDVAKTWFEQSAH